jgi:hypothetical protein
VAAKSKKIMAVLKPVGFAAGGGIATQFARKVIPASYAKYAGPLMIAGGAALAYFMPDYKEIGYGMVAVGAVETMSSFAPGMASGMTLPGMAAGVFQDDTGEYRVIPDAQADPLPMMGVLDIAA